MGHSPETRAKMAAAAKERWSRSGEREAQSARLKEAAPWRGKTLSEEHRLAISLGGKGIPHLLSSTRRKQLGNQGRRVLEEIRRKPDHSSKLSKAQKKRGEREGGSFGFRVKERQEKSLASRLERGTLIPQSGGRGICGFRRDLPHYCRSTFEANFARVLTYLQVPYEYEPRLFRLKNGSHYTPDFHLTKPVPGYPSLVGWVELKGWRKADGTVPSQGKIDAFCRETGEKIFVLTEKDSLWALLTSQVGSLIPLWETPRRNLRKQPLEFGVPNDPICEAS